MDEVGDRIPIVNGIYADGSLEAARLAKAAAEGGASALLVFPPALLRAAASAAEMALVEHFKRIAEATDLPLIAFQYPVATGQGYPLETLQDGRGSADDPRHQGLERQRAAAGAAGPRRCTALRRPVNVLTTHSAWLFTSLVLGCGGLLSGRGSVIADLQARAVPGGAGATTWPRRRRSTTASSRRREVFYAEPSVDMHNRMKEALVLLGKLPRAVVRPPLKKISEAEIGRIAAALEQAGLLQGQSLAAE